MTRSGPRRATPQDVKSTPAKDTTSHAERELYGGRLRYDQSYVRHAGPLTRLSFRRVAAALPRMVALVLRTGWQSDRRAMAGVVTAQLGKGVTAAWGLVVVNRVLKNLFAAGSTANKLREALSAVTALAASVVIAALLAAWSTATPGRVELQVERAVSARYYTAVTRVEVEGTEYPEVQRVLEAGRFGTDSARSMLMLSVGVGNVLISMVAAAVILASLYWMLLPMLLVIALPKGWGAVAYARRECVSKLHWIDHRRAIASLLGFLTRPHAQGEIRVHAAGTKLLASYEELSHRTEAEQRRAGGFAGMASLLLADGCLPLTVGGTAVLAIRASTARLTSLAQQVNRLHEELLFVTDTEDAIPTTGAPLPARVHPNLDNVSCTCPRADSPALRNVSVRVRGDNVTALVGANGSGKTTLTKVLSGLLLRPDRSVWWQDADGRDQVELRDANRAESFAMVGLLVQDFPRWEMSAATNVAIGGGVCVRDMIQVKAAALSVGVLKLIETVRQGWDSFVHRGYERGVQLSGGRWQRLGTVRSLYRGAPFLLVDEPTSALDPHAQIAVFKGLWSLAEEGHAVVLVTHRLAATANADRIYVLDQGQVAEEGTHQRLMARSDGIYRSMFTAQVARYRATAHAVPSQLGHATALNPVKGGPR